MRYIKKFENWESYEEGDYLLLIPEEYTEEHRYVKVMPTEKSTRAMGLLYITTLLLGKNEMFFIEKNDVLRKLTPDEIKEIPMKSDSHKSNL